MSVATNVGVVEAAGSTVVLVRPEAMPPRQPIAERLAGVLREPGVGVAQPLVVDLDGVVLSAGARFTTDNPHPELFLAGLPTSDAVRIGQCAVAAPASPLVALRTETAVALHGLDSRYHSVLAETDLGLRAQRRRPRRIGARARRGDHLPHRLRRGRGADRRDVVAARDRARRAAARDRPLPRAARRPPGSR